MFDTHRTTYNRICRDRSLIMNELSDKLGITIGTATVAISKLSDKEAL